MSALPDVIQAEQTSRSQLIVDALHDLEQGKPLRAIARDRGIPYATLRVWMIDDLGEQYRPLQRRALLHRIAEADEELETASNHLAVSRAREQCKFTRWDAERRLPALFAPKQEIGAPGDFKQLEDRELARRFAYLEQVAKAIEGEVIPESGTT